MYNGIGLQTPRGSGTNGHIQTNKFFVRAKTGRITENTKGFEAGQGMAGVTRKPNKDILEHERKRHIQLKLTVLEDKLVDQGYTEAEIAEKLLEARKTLEADEASEEGSGSTAVVVADTKVSETETHKIAARKEKQMEAFRAALGIGRTEPEEREAGEIDEGPRSGYKNGPNDDNKWQEKNEHAFLDRESGRRRCTEEDGKLEREDKKNGVKDVKSKETRHHNKKVSGKRRRHRYNSSDSDNGSEHAEEISKKHHRGSRRSDYESDTDTDNHKKKSKSSRKHKKSRKHYSDSSSDDDIGAKHKKSRKHVSDSSDSSPDDDEIRKVDSKKVFEKYEKSHIRHDLDDECVFDEDSSKHKTQKGKQHMKTRVRHDSEDDFDSDSEMEKKISQLEKQSKQEGGSRRRQRDHSDVEPQQKSDDDRYRPSSRRHDADVEKWGSKSRRNDTVDKSDAVRYNQIEKHKRSKRHDTDDEDSDSSYGRKSNKVRAQKPKAIERKSAPMTNDSDNINTNGDESGRRSSGVDSDSSPSDDRYGRSGKTSVGKNKSECGERSDRGGGDKTRGISGQYNDDALDSLRKLEEKSLHQFRRESGDRDRSSSGHQEVITGKRNFDDSSREERRESKLRSQIVVKEAKNIDHSADPKNESEINTRSRGNKDDRRGDDRDYKEHVSGRRPDKDDEDHKLRKHQRNEEGYKYRKHEKADEEIKILYHSADAKNESELNARSRGSKDDTRGDDRDYRERISGRRHSMDEEDHKMGRRHSMDEEDHKMRKRQRDEQEDYKYIKHEKDDEELPKGSRGYGRGEEEERGSKSHARDRQTEQTDYFKRGRYDDSRSSERKRDEYKHSDDRSRHRD